MVPKPERADRGIELCKTATSTIEIALPHTHTLAHVPTCLGWLRKWMRGTIARRRKANKNISLIRNQHRALSLPAQTALGGFFS